MSMTLKRMTRVVLFLALTVVFVACGEQTTEHSDAIDPVQEAEAESTPEPMPEPTPTPQGEFSTIDDWHIRVDSVEFTQNLRLSGMTLSLPASPGRTFAIITLSVINDGTRNRELFGSRENILSEILSARQIEEIDGWHRIANIVYDEDTRFGMDTISSLFGQSIQRDRTTEGTLVFSIPYEIVDSDGELTLRVIPNFPRTQSIDFSLR